MRRVWRYVVRYDDGLAPCVADGYCTLTCCKPRVRKYAKEGDWIIGFHSKRVGRAKLCYAMRVTEKPMPYAAYWNDPRFQKRRDNIYQPINGDLVWVANAVRDHDDQPTQEKDRRGLYALISNDYWYFGEKDAFSLYDHLRSEMVDRLWYQHRGQTCSELRQGELEHLLAFLDKQKPTSIVMPGVRASSCKPHPTVPMPKPITGATRRHC